MGKITGGSCFPPYAPPQNCCNTPVDCIESDLLLLLLRVGMERFLPSAGGSSAAGLRPCGEPTRKIKSSHDASFDGQLVGRERLRPH